MRAYLVKRILIMVPTFVGITLIIFAVLNFAPGRPGAGQQGGDIGVDLRGEQTQESYQIFREQFDLDKPVLINTRFALEQADVERELVVLTRAVPSNAAERVRAQVLLEDYGSYVVPHWITILREADAAGETRRRDLAVHFLRLAARRRLIAPFDPDPSKEQRSANRAIDRENAHVRELRIRPDDSDARAREVVDAWYAWYGEHRERWEWDAGDKLRIFFLETRFATYWRNLVRLDFGVSLVTKKPVLDELISRLPYSISLSVGSLVLAYLISIPLGVFSAVRKDTPADRSATVVLFMLYSLPSFFVATLLLYFFSTGSDYPALRIFPTGGWSSRDAAQLSSLHQIGDVGFHLVLPMLCMTYGSLAQLSRYMRSGLLDVIRSDYVRTARAKGLPEWIVIGKHAVRNGLLPILTLLAGLLPAVLGGSIIIEFIFGIPGIGLWMIDSIYQRDYNAIMVVQLFSTLLVLVGILLTDLAYALVDPRIRFE